jgi:hypothetical protein
VEPRRPQTSAMLHAVVLCVLCLSDWAPLHPRMSQTADTLPKMLAQHMQTQSSRGYAACTKTERPKEPKGPQKRASCGESTASCRAQVTHLHSMSNALYDNPKNAMPSPHTRTPPTQPCLLLQLSVQQHIEAASCLLPSVCQPPAPVHTPPLLPTSASAQIRTGRHHHHHHSAPGRV